MNDTWEPTLAAADARLAAVRPDAYARSRNALKGAVTGLSPYITHGFLSIPDVAWAVAERHRLDARHKFVFELGWREYFRHVWHHRGDGIFRSLHAGPLPDSAYLSQLPADIRRADTRVPAIDQAVRTLYRTGTLHNHARMWLGSYVVHVRKVHWRAGADWLYSHLLDGDLASNHLSWQWVAGTSSSKPYLFNAGNVARWAPSEWHSAGSVIDVGYDEMDRMARRPLDPIDRAADTADATGDERVDVEPAAFDQPPPEFGFSSPDAADVAGRDVVLIHPWCLGRLPDQWPSDAVRIGLCVAEFHRAWPWSGAVGSSSAGACPT